MASERRSSKAFERDGGRWPRGAASPANNKVSVEALMEMCSGQGVESMNRQGFQCQAVSKGEEMRRLNRV